MNKALFAALASVALLGASCSVQDFSTVVMDKPTITASLPVTYAAASNPNGYLSTAYTTGKYSFRYGLLSDNLFDKSQAVFKGGNLDSVSNYACSTGYYLPLEAGTYSVRSNLPVFVVKVNSVATQSLTNGDLYTPNDYFYDYQETFTIASSGYLGLQIAKTIQELFATDWYLMLSKTSAPLDFQPFCYGVSVDTPFLKSPRSFSLPLDASFKPDGQFTYNGFDGDGYQWMFKYGYDYVDAAHPRTIQTCIGMTFVSDEQREVFLTQFEELALPRREYSNCSYVDYELGAVDGNDGHCGLYLYFRPVFFSNQFVSSFMSFDTGNFDDGYTDGYTVGYSHGYADGLTYEIVKNIDEVSLSYITGSGDDSENHNVARGGRDASALLRDNCINGLLQLDAIYDELIPSADSDAAHDLVLLLSYSEVKTVDAAPIYIDYKQLADPIPYAQQTELTLSISVNLPIQRWTAFNAHLDVGYQGDVGNYPQYSYDARFRNYSKIEVRYPLRNVGGRLAYLGILSDYSRGYADGVASRDGEVDDLTERILGLEEDLSQYQGKTYEQIYNLGVQAGLDENAQGAATFNSLFGNILTAPLTILNGLTDISFFGMPILTAILSLLMVAMALFLFKRFK